MYKANQYVLLAAGGLWHIDAISGVSYTVSSCSNPRDIRTITDEAIIRPICSRDTITEALSRLPYLQTLRAVNDQARQELYDDAMAQYDELAWIQVIKTIYLRQAEKKQLPTEPALFARAQRYLHEEIALLLDIAPDEVENYITCAIAQNIW